MLSKWLGKLVAKIRRKAMRIKAVRVKVAGNVVDTLMTVTQSPQAVKTQEVALEGLLAFGRVVPSLVVFYRAILKLSAVVVKDENLQKGLKALVGNILSDIANRLNEAANLIEASGKNSKVSEAFEEVRTSFEEYSETFEAEIKHAFKQ